MLETFLDLYRDILKRKLTGLSDQQIRQRHVPSATTLGGLAKHLTAVEREWFQGSDEGDDVSGRGWPALSPDGTLEGHIYFHLGDDSAFRAERGPG